MHIQRKRGIASSLAILVVVIVIVAVIAGVGWSEALTGAKTTTVTGSGGGNSALVAQAQSECASASTCLTIASTVDASDWASEIGPAFFMDYPFAQGKVNYQGLSAGQITTEAISDYQANQVKFDDIWVTEGIVYPVILAGGILNYSTNPLLSPSSGLNYTGSAVGVNDTFVVTFLSVVVLQYNPSVMAANNLPVPQNWSALANPIYKGFIGMQTATSLSATTGLFYYLYTQMGNSSGQWTSLMNGIAANQPVITSSSSATTSNIATGKVALGPGLYNDCLSAATETPGKIACKQLSPTPYNPGVTAITKNAPDPAMAQLFLQWTMTAAGQLALATSNRAPLTPFIANEFHLVPPNGTVVNSYTNPAIFQNPTAWSTTFKNIFGA